MFTIKRSHENPVLLPDRDQSWEAAAVFNGCPIRDHGIVHLVYRAESTPQLCNGVTIPVSSIGHATSTDGVHFSNRRQLIRPEYEWEQYGCEDPRVVKHGDTFYIFYTALSKYPFSPDGIRIAVALTKDFKTIIAKHPVTTFNAKAMSLFPTEVGGKLAALLTVNTDRPPATIALASFNTIEDIWSPAYWNKWYEKLSDHAVPLRRSNNDHIELGAPPVWTKHGWLFIYSYIRNYFSGGQRTFGIEAALLDAHDPRKVVSHLDRPLLTPDEEYELYGRVPNIVFPSGALVASHDKMVLYYGAADSTCCIATVAYKDFLTDLKAGKTEPATRYNHNPIIKPVAEHAWEAKATFNPAAVEIGSKVHLLYRAMSADNTSVFGYAATVDGLKISDRLPAPVYQPRAPFEQKLTAGGNSGCEDARLTLLGDTVYMCYTAFDGKNPPRVALSSISKKDFVAKRWTWEKPRLISPPGLDDKDAALFPEKIDGQYVFLHRLGNSIWIDAVDDLKFSNGTYLKGHVLMSPRTGLEDSQKIGIAGPPIALPQGWLLFYHGISRDSDHDYSLRAVLLDRDDPTRIISRTKDPILEPVMPYEMVGQVPNVVFSCGVVLRSKKLFIYYGAADTVTGVATLPLATLLKQLVP